MSAARDRRHAVPIYSDTMAPRCLPGQFVMADATKRVRGGSEVLVCMRVGYRSEATAYFGWLVRRTEDVVEISQLNPPKTVTLDMVDIVAVHRVIGIFDGP